MYFKRFLAVSLLVLQAACGLNVGEKAPEERPIRVGGNGFSCLSKIGETVESFLGARLTDEDVHKFMSCIRYSFTSFANYTRGQDRYSYSPDEIRQFLTKYFLKDRVISDGLLNDFMVIKQTMVGGPLDKVTRLDLQQVDDLLQVVEEQALKLNPYMNVYNFKIGQILFLDQTGKDPKIEKAVTVLQDVADRFGQRLAKANSPYPLIHFKSFIERFRHFSGWEGIFEDSREPESWVQFFAAFKAVTTGHQTQVIAPKEWPRLLSSSAGWYGVVLKGKYVRDSKSMLYGDGLDSFINTVDDATAIVRASIDDQPSKVITLDRLDSLIDTLGPVGLLPRVALADGNTRPVKPENLKITLRALLNRIFGESKIPWQERRSEGLSRFVLSQAIGEFSRWTDIQRYLDRTFMPGSKAAPMAGQHLETLSEKLSPSTVIGKMIRPQKDGPVDSSVANLRYIEKNLRPLFRPGEDRIFLTEQNELPRYGVVHGFHNLSIMNVLRGAVALLMRGYSSTPSLPQPFSDGLTSDELQAFYLDFRGLGVDLQLFDPRSENAGNRAFREANIFTYSGNGVVKLPKDEVTAEMRQSSLFNFTEAMEYLAFMYSGGQLGRALYSSMMDLNTGVCSRESQGSPLSVHFYPMVRRSCFRNNLIEQVIPLLTNMPKMKEQMERASRKSRQDMADGLIATTFSKKFSSEEWVEWHELVTIAVIIHYSEAVMTRYNKDGDSILNMREVRDAYPTFSGYIGELVYNQCESFALRSGYQFPTEQELTQPNLPTQGAPMNAVTNWAREWRNELYDISRQFQGSQRSFMCRKFAEGVTEPVFAILIKTGEVPNFKNFWKGAIGSDIALDRLALTKVFSALVKASSEGN